MTSPGFPRKGKDEELASRNSVYGLAQLEAFVRSEVDHCVGRGGFHDSKNSAEPTVDPSYKPSGFVVEVVYVDPAVEISEWPNNVVSFNEWKARGGGGHSTSQICPPGRYILVLSPT